MGQVCWVGNQEHQALLPACWPTQQTLIPLKRQPRCTGMLQVGSVRLKFSLCNKPLDLVVPLKSQALDMGEQLLTDITFHTRMSMGIMQNRQVSKAKLPLGLCTWGESFPSPRLQLKHPWQQVHVTRPTTSFSHDSIFTSPTSWPEFFFFLLFLGDGHMSPRSKGLIYQDL